MNREEMILKYFSVTENGVVTNIKTGKELTQQMNAKGYLRVFPSIDHKQYQVRVHRLVAVMYILNPFNYNLLHHKDFVKTNNHKDNLEWSTNEIIYARADAYGRANRYGSQTPRSKLIEQDVIKIRRRLRSGESQKRVYEDYASKISRRSFRDICRGKSWTQIT
jgi:hypothetical protein